jgi:hypothetical protein
MRKRTIVVLAVVAATGIGLCAYRFGAAGRALMRLLEGDRTVQISRIEFDRAGDIRTLEDQSSMLYFASALATAKNEGYIGRSGGVLSIARIRLRDIGVADVRVYVTPDESGFELSPEDGRGFDDPTYYWIEFIEPVPKPFRKFIRDLRVASGQVKSSSGPH